MAQQGNIICVSNSDQGTTISATRNVKVSDIIFTAKVAADTFELRETSDGPPKIIYRHAIANDTHTIHFQTPVVFGQGIYLQTLSANCYLMLVLA